MIIAFGHRKQQGKDTAVNAILQYAHSTHTFGGGPQPHVVARSFAEPLYDVCQKLVPEFKGKVYYDSLPEEKERVIERLDATPREILIEVGQCLKTVLGSDCFAVGLLAHRSAHETTLITDLRFPCEIHAIKRAKGICVLVERPSVEKSDDKADVALSGFDGWDRVLINDCSKEEFERKAVRLYREITGR